MDKEIDDGNVGAGASSARLEALLSHPKNEHAQDRLGLVHILDGSIGTYRLIANTAIQLRSTTRERRRQEEQTDCCLGRRISMSAWMSG